jgi:hypothetical protein
MKIIKNIFVLLVSITFSFGIWYCIFWLLSNQNNPLLWSPYVKTFFLALSIVFVLIFAEIIDEPKE